MSNLVRPQGHGGADGGGEMQGAGVELVIEGSLGVFITR